MTKTLPLTRSLLPTAPTMVTSSPSRIQTVPSPITTSQWKRDQGSRSRRAGIRVVIVLSFVASVVTYRPY